MIALTFDQHEQTIPIDICHTETKRKVWIHGYFDASLVILFSNSIIINQTDWPLEVSAVVDGHARPIPRISGNIYMASDVDKLLLSTQDGFTSKPFTVKDIGFTSHMSVRNKRMAAE